MIIERCEVRKDVPMGKFKYTVTINGRKVELESDEAMDLEELKIAAQEEMTCNGS